MKRLQLPARLAMSLLLVAAAARILPRLDAAELLSEVPSGAPLVAPLEAAVEADPDNATAHFRLGLRHRDLLSVRDPARAVHHLGRAVALNPYDWHAWEELGAAQEITGDPAAAEAAYVEAARRNPRKPEYSWRLGNLYLRRGDLERALPALARAVEERPAYAPAAYTLLRAAGATPQQIAASWPRGPELTHRLDRLLARESDGGEQR
ncbi:MAG TPA: tetratricopeptide repeat protein [Thermoanaerobaculia bacterium]|nr:tetratricopeptide repeat protein [Thermoanaerobaculia bacterium]